MKREFSRVDGRSFHRVPIAIAAELELAASTIALDMSGEGTHRWRERSGVYNDRTGSGSVPARDHTFPCISGGVSHMVCVAASNGKWRE